MFLRKNYRALWRCHFRQLMILGITGLLLYTLVRFYSAKKEVIPSYTLLRRSAYEPMLISIDGDETAVEGSANSIKSLLSTNDCPLCFGKVQCKNLEASLVLETLDTVSTTSRKIVQKALWKSSESVLIKTLPALHVKSFERHLCQMKTPFPCKNNKLVKPIQDVKFTAKHLQVINEHADRNRSIVPISLCVTEKLFIELERLFDEDSNENISAEEDAMLITSAILNPEIVALRFFKVTNLNVPVPQYYGSCGRSLVVEGGLTPLKEFLREPFEVRAGLAVKILQMVDDFMENDPEWSVMFSGFSYDNLAVDKNGEVVILDIADLVLLDKNEYQHGDVNDVAREPCNRDCFSKFTYAVLKLKNVHEVCQMIPRHMQLMYAIICQQILSNLEEHRVKNYFHSPTDPEKLENAGLLHGLPAKDQQYIEELLRECVVETEDGGRIQAAEELRDLLSEYTNLDDELADDKEDYDDKLLEKV